MYILLLSLLEVDVDLLLLLLERHVHTTTARSRCATIPLLLELGVLLLLQLDVLQLLQSTVYYYENKSIHDYRPLSSMTPSSRCRRESVRLSGHEWSWLHPSSRCIPTNNSENSLLPSDLAKVACDPFLSHVITPQVCANANAHVFADTNSMALCLSCSYAWAGH